MRGCSGWCRQDSVRDITSVDRRHKTRNHGPLQRLSMCEIFQYSWFADQDLHVTSWANGAGDNALT